MPHPAQKRLPQSSPVFALRSWLLLFWRLWQGHPVRQKRSVRPVLGVIRAKPVIFVRYESLVLWASMSDGLCTPIDMRPQDNCSILRCCLNRLPFFGHALCPFSVIAWNSLCLRPWLSDRSPSDATTASGGYLPRATWTPTRPYRPCTPQAHRQSAHARRGGAASAGA